MNEAHSPNIPARVGGVALARGNDAELDELVDIVDRHARLLGELLTGESAHDLAMVLARVLRRVTPNMILSVDNQLFSVGRRLQDPTGRLIGEWRLGLEGT
jgi:hypothetical protein